MLRHFICTCLGAFGAVGTVRRISTNYILAVTVMIVVGSFGQTAFADWIDTKTGKHVTSFPIAPGPGTYKLGHNHVVLPETGDPNRAFDPETGRNFARESCPPRTATTPRAPPQVGMVTPGPSIKLSGELGGGWSRNGFEDFNFNGSGFVGGVSGQFNFPISGNTYAGLSVSVLGSGISGTTADPITSNIRLLVPIDGILGATFMPSGLQWPLSVYGFGGLAIGDVNISAPPFSATQTMTGWSIGVGGDLQLSPTWSVGVKYRHFDLGTANFSIFPGGTSLVTERGDMVTGTLSYRFPIAQ